MKMSSDRQIANSRGMLRADPRPEDSPERFYELPDARQMELLAWVADQPVDTLCSWSLTSVAIARRVTREVGWQVSNGELKAAMALCGFVARNPDDIAWTFFR